MGLGAGRRGGVQVTNVLKMERRSPAQEKA